MSNASLVMNLGSLTSSLSSLGSAIPATAEQNMHIACAELEGSIKDRAPVDSGHLRASYESRVDRNGDTVIGHVGTNVEYGAYQEYLGTPHVRPSLDARRSDLLHIIGAKTISEALGNAR